MKYWEKRQTDLYKAGEKRVNEYYRDLEKAFEQAKRDIRRVIDTFYGRYASENGISYAEARKRLSKAEIGDLKEFIALVFGTLGEKDTEVINRSIKARITRYEALELQIDAILRRLYVRDYEQAGTQMLHDLYEDSYYRTWWNIDSYHGFHSEFAGIDQSAVDALVNYPFNGANFSSRLWKQKDYLQQRLMESLTTMMIQGADPKSLSRNFSKLFHQREYDAYRLLHTEYSFMCESASQAAYAEDGVPEYEYMATLDSRTCEICGKHDGEIVKIGKGKTGINMPPLHPLCRCTTAPHYPDDMTEDGNRFARDADGNAIEVPDGMKYPEWKQKFVVDPADEREYQKYISVLVDHAPKTLDEFKDIKYNNKNRWSVLQREYSTISKIQNKETYSEEYRKKMIDLYYEFRDEEIEMTDHSLNRFLGQKTGAGKKNFTKDELIKVKRKKANFKQKDGRLIHFYNSLSVVENEKTGEVVTIVVRGKAKQDWDRI